MTVQPRARMTYRSAHLPGAPWAVQSSARAPNIGGRHITLLSVFLHTIF